MRGLWFLVILNWSNPAHPSISGGPEIYDTKQECIEAGHLYADPPPYAANPSAYGGWRCVDFERPPLTPGSTDK
jgi:hypothetical protein